MSGPLYLAWRYALRHPAKTSILVAAIALIVFLPVGLQVLVGQSARELTARAESTPLLVGARGSALELVLSSLYLESRPPEPTDWAQVERVEATGLARAIPLHLGFQARGHPIVGTTLDYFDFRGLHVAQGRRMAVLGECVLGARAARALGLAPGGELVSSSETVFDLAGDYPLKMRVAGVLAPSHTPDDEAVFVDVKTAWVIEGLGHGHQDLAAPDAETAVLAREGSSITANASVVEYQEITPANADSFHFHGDLSAYPISAVIAVAPDAKSRALLMGRYEGENESQQVLRPVSVMDELLETVVTIQVYVVAAIAIVSAATLATAALVFLLSLRLRGREIETLVKIGGARISVAAVLASEVVVVLSLGILLAAALTLVTSRFGSAAIRALLLS
ncbi:MAG: ABC transporter permease [Deltaproteobacteria bacterium]|nr:ABC transporter permease [Deltaproteobacteria bacterium]MBW2414285.1 ABC transporter permease [Deltaproteobacteria bacterium]